MTMDPLISIVVIGRNEEANIARCLASCFAADWGNKEIIYCDSESSDRSAEIAREYPARVIVHKNRRRNPSIGRNIGLRAARGDYVYFIDADMVLERDFLRRAFPVLVSREDIAYVVGRWLEVDLGNPYHRLIDAGYHAYNSFGEVEAASGGGGLFKRQALLEVGGYYERYYCPEEQILGQELRKRGYRLFLLDVVMAHHDLGVDTFAKFVQFRARQARMMASALLLGDRIFASNYRIAWRHFAEGVLALAWVFGLIAIAPWRLPYLSASLCLLAATLVLKYWRERYRPLAGYFFVYEFILGKPFHILFQMYYLIGGLLGREDPSRLPDGEIIADRRPQSEHMTAGDLETASRGLA